MWLDELSYDAKNITNDTEKMPTWPLTKAEKNTVNDFMEKVRFSHIPHAETDNPALVAWHEEMEKELNIQVATMVMEKHIKHNLTGLDWKTLQENDPIIQHVLKWKWHNSDKNAWKEKNNTDRLTLEEYLLTMVNSYDAKVHSERQHWHGITVGGACVQAPSSAGLVPSQHRTPGQRQDILAVAKEILVAKDEDADDDDPAKLWEMQGVWEERPESAIV